MVSPSPQPTARAMEALWRIEASRIIGGLARLVRDVGLAEDLAQEALIEALEHWPRTGVPANPAAWLMTTAKRRAVDRFRRNKMRREKSAEIARDLDAREDVSIAHIEATMDDDIGDERLALIFTACHPVLTPEAQIALTLRLIGGLTPEEIARAFLVNPTTIQQRIVRAKKTLRDADIAYEIPHGAAKTARLAAVLAVVYLIFNEGHAATSGPDWMRPPLAREAQRLARIIAGLMPGEPETLGLLALLDLTAARMPARIDPDGAPIPLEDQDRTKWDRLMIRRGLEALQSAQGSGAPAGPYRLQAEIAACHARAATAPDTDWKRIAALYDALMAIQPTPVVALNHAVAHGRAFGPETGLRLADVIAKGGALENYALLPGVRGLFLAELGRNEQAAAAFGAAASLSQNARERAHFLARARALGG